MTSVNNQIKPCELKPAQWLNRVEHSNLMLKLLKRYHDKDITEKLKGSDFEQMKLELVRSYSRK